MRLTKFNHACVKLEKDGKAIVIDPGSFSELETALSGVNAVLVTHEHMDHIDIDAVTAALQADPDLLLHAPGSVTKQLGEAAPEVSGQIKTVEPGEEFETAGFTVHAYGGQHALIHPRVPIVANLGYVIDGKVYHPGDALIVPEDIQVQTLLVPLHAPWAKMSEMIDFVTAVRAPMVYQIHDALLSDIGFSVMERMLTQIAGLYGIQYQHLRPGESIEI